MLFTFKRDDEGREKVYVNDIPIALRVEHPEGWAWLSDVPGITPDHIADAAVKADEAGFWTPLDILPVECTVDVPVADNAVLSVTLPGDES